MNQNYSTQDGVYLSGPENFWLVMFHKCACRGKISKAFSFVTRNICALHKWFQLTGRIWPQTPIGSCLVNVKKFPSMGKINKLGIQTRHF